MQMNSVISENKESTNEISSMDIKLPSEWVLYLYDKLLFKKMANRPNFQAKPHRSLCTISTVNDAVYLLQLMEVKVDSKTNIDCINKINLDMNDYIIMRKDIEPIWEDPKNSNGGTFTIKMNHDKGYDIWSTFVMYILGETLTNDMQNINGITVSYIPNSTSFHGDNIFNGYGQTYIKIWDAKPDRTRDQFISILPKELINKIKSDSIMYTPNNKKKHYGQEDIINKLTNPKKNSYNKNNFRKSFRY